MTQAAGFDTELLARDFDSLPDGASFSSRARTVTEADIVAFSALTGDWHPQHADAEWAAQSPFGERIAHGMLVLSIALGLVDLNPARVVALRKLLQATFKAPVRIGDTIHAEGSIASRRQIDEDTGLVQVRWRVVNQTGRTVVVFALELIWRRERGR